MKNSMDEKFGSFTNMTVPTHTHNHVDAPAVVMGDLSLDNRGLIFPSFDGRYVINILNGIGGQSQFYISPPVDKNGNPLGSLSLNGPNGEVYKVITFSSLTDTNISTGSMTGNQTNWLFQPGKTTVVSNTNWFLRLPVDSFSGLPASPVLGDIAYASADAGLTGNLYVCQSPGVWTLK